MRRRPATIVLAVLLLAMAAGQLSDPAGFVDIVADYEVGPRWTAWVLAVVLIGGELAAGAGLLGGRTARPASAIAVAVAVLWSVVAVQAFARGLRVDNCGCFGVHVAQELRWWVLVQDVEFVALALWVRGKLRAASPNDSVVGPAGIEPATQGL